MITTSTLFDNFLQHILVRIFQTPITCSYSQYLYLHTYFPTLLTMFQHPHCIQRYHPSNLMYLQADPKAFTRVLTPQSMGCLPYEDYNYTNNSLLHWGQRKLLLPEIEFLQLCTQDPLAQHCKTVVYAGAASGVHLLLLFKWFPTYKFILVDPGIFNTRVKKYAAQNPKQVIIHHCTFETVITHKWLPQQFLFISDIRNTATTKSHSSNNQLVQEDMQKQMQWVLQLHPVRSMLKFRLPFPYNIDTQKYNTHYEYLTGDIYLPVWGSPGTAECRLITHSNDYSLKFYNCLLYEQQMRYFNVVMRPSVFHQSIYNLSCGYDQCYDCCTEQQIIQSLHPHTHHHIIGAQISQSLCGPSHV
jgi:cap2 methyltransferase